MAQKRITRITNPKGSYEPEHGVQNTDNPPAPNNAARSRGFGIGPVAKRAWRAITAGKEGGR